MDRVTRARTFPQSVATGIILGLVSLGPVSAQTWSVRTNDSGALLTAVAHAPEFSLSFLCTAPAPRGRPLLETGEHEAQRTDGPFTVILTAGDSLMDPYADASTLSARMTLDGTTFGLPPMPWDELFWNWSVTLPMTDPMVLQAVSARSMIFDGGRGTAWQYPVDGLSDALTQALRFCAQGWQRAGHTVPGALVPVVGETAPAPVSAPAGQGQDTEARMRAEVNAHCGGSYRIEDEGIIRPDVNADGVADTVLFWGAVSCFAGDYAGMIGGGVCGASQCATEVFLSGGTGGSEFELYSQGPVLDPGRPGEIGFGMNLSSCQGMGLMPACVAWYRWDGRELSRTN